MVGEVRPSFDAMWAARCELLHAFYMLKCDVSKLVVGKRGVWYAGACAKLDVVWTVGQTLCKRWGYGVTVESRVVLCRCLDFGGTWRANSGM